MSLPNRVMGLGLNALNRFAGLPLVDRLRLRKPSEKLLYQATRAGFTVAAAASRQFTAAHKRLAPVRPGQRPSADLFDLTPSDDQALLRDAVAAFADRELRNAAQAADRACAATPALLRAAADLGITPLSVPEEYGGAGQEHSAVTNLLVAEALAHGDTGLAVAILAPTAVVHALTLWGDADQQARYLPAFARDSAPVAALAVQEPRALFNPFALSTTARRSGDGYVLNGVKSLVPRAAECELLIVAAQLDGEGPALFLLESSTPGIAIAPEPAMGLRAAATAQLRLDNVTLPARARLGDADSYRACIRRSRLAWSALAVGGAQAVLDYLIPYVNGRVAFGEPISHRQAVAFAVADTAIELEGLRLSTLRAAARADAGKDFAREAALSRRLAADKAVRIGSDGVQLLGGHGYTQEYPVERWYRDLRAVGMLEGIVLI